MKDRLKICVALLGVLIPLLIGGLTTHAQTVTYVDGTEAVGFTQSAPDVATSNAYKYFLVVDGTRQATAIAGVTCTGTASPFDCVSAHNVLPALTVGAHTLAVWTAAVNPIDQTLNYAPAASASISVTKISTAPPSSPNSIRVIH